MSPAPGSFFGALNQGIEAPTGFLNFGYLALDAEGRPRRGRTSPTATSVALVGEVVAPIDLDGATVVEVGCGRGGNLRWLRRHRRPAGLVGLDLEPTSVRAAREVAADPDLPVLVGDARALPLRRAGTGVVLNVESSCLYGDLAAFYAEVARVLHPGGWFAYADVLPRALVEDLPHHLGTVGLATGPARDLTENVRASVAVRRDRADGGAAAFLAWFHERLGAGDLAYVCLQARRDHSPPTASRSPGPLGGGLEGLQAFVAEALERAQSLA